MLEYDYTLHSLGSRYFIDLSSNNREGCKVAVRSQNPPNSRARGPVSLGRHKSHTRSTNPLCQSSLVGVPKSWRFQQVTVCFIQSQALRFPLTQFLYAARSVWICWQNPISVSTPQSKSCATPTSTSCQNHWPQHSNRHTQPRPPFWANHPL